METKLVKRNRTALIPAGILKGIESFFDEDTQKSWVIFNGKAMPFSEAPGWVQRLFAKAFMNDLWSRNYLKTKMNITAFSEGFEKWLKCRAGGLDNVPDFNQGSFVADGYNNACKDYNCPHRGKFCSLKAGLNSIEEETIRVLQEGNTIQEAAKILIISVLGLKSRIEKIKEKLDASNMASMIAKASKLGI